MWNVALLLIRYTRRHNVASASATFDIMSRDIVAVETTETTTETTLF